MLDLNGKVAIVTGGGGPGSGRAYARRLASSGCQVVVLDIDDAGGEETVKRIREVGGTAVFRHCDVSKHAEVEALIAFTEQTFGGLDVLVNNAGARFSPGAPMEKWYDAINTDLLGTMYATQFSVAAMLRRGGGVILNISSTSALGHGPEHSAAPDYDTAKIGILRLTTTLGRLQRTHNIRVNCLVPDWVATPEVKEYFESLSPDERRNPRIPPVLTSLDEIADAALSLITDESLNGRVLVWWSGREPGLVRTDDPGYDGLEPYRLASFKPPTLSSNASLRL